MKDAESDRTAREREPFLDETENDATEAVEEGEPYFPPTDPVVREGSRQTRILGGFAESAMDDDGPEPRTHVGGLADEALADEVRRALRQADNALAVAGRVRGIADVVDEIEVEAGAS